MSGSSTGLELHCDKCGKAYAHPKRLTSHALRCTGAVATRGRIDRLARRPSTKRAVPADRNPAATVLVPAVVSPAQGGRPRKPFVDERTERRREQYRRSKNGDAPRTPMETTGAIAAAATDKAIELAVAGLRARRAQLDTAIAALEALA